MTATPVVSLSELDSRHFGFRIARANDVSQGALPGVLEFCRANAVEMLIVRCPATELGAVQRMEEFGFRLMDALIYLECDPARASAPPSGEAIVRGIRPGEEARVAEIAATVFRGYRGHYHADPRLDQRSCDEAYVSWAERSCALRSVADEVIVAELDGTVAAFFSLKLLTQRRGEFLVGGVHPAYQGRGIYPAVLYGGIRWFAERGVASIVTSTQITNVGMLKILPRLGFEASQSVYTFHKWFDEPA
jgi:RimJ/RimL family protein N-acetyltransferase